MTYKRTHKYLPNHQKPRSGKQIESDIIDDDKYTSVIFETPDGIPFSAYGNILERVCG